MASGLFFDPMTLLRLAPIITSTASLTFAHDQDLFFRPFIHESQRQKSNAFLPGWSKEALPRAFWVIFALYPTTAALTLTNIYTGDAGEARKFYWAGLAFTFGHFLFGMKALRLLDAIENDKSKGNSTQDMKSWLDNNTLRSFSVDLPGWISFICAAMISLKA